MLASAMASSLLTFCVFAPLSAQNIHITNAPFTATITSTHDGKTSVESEVARSSDGSTYEANKTADGRIFRIEITNVPENLRFVLYPSPPSYTYQVLPA
jgi:hypothetical protein